MTVTDMAMLGHLGTDYLAASSLASVWMTITNTLLWPFADVVRMLTSQALGAKNPALAGVWLQAGWFWLSLVCIPVGALWLLTDVMLHLFKMDTDLASKAQTFATWSLLWLWPRAMYAVIEASLQSMNILYPQLILSLMSVGLNVGLNWLFIHGGIFGWKGLGFIGSPIATSVSQILLVLALYGYVSKRRVLARIWPGWRRECISKRRSAIFLKQALPLMVGQAVEEWQIQVITGFAGRLGKTQIATHNALLELFFWLSAGMFGILQGTSVRCAFHLGNADVEGAKRVSRVALASALGLGLIVASVLIGARNYIGYIYSHDHAVVKETGKISWVVGVSYDLLSFFYVAMAILQAQARPNYVAVAFLIGAWLISVPLSYLLAFKAHLHLIGLWYGMVGGYAVITAIAAIGVLRSDWHKISREAIERSTLSEDERAIALATDDLPPLDITPIAVDMSRAINTDTTT